MNTQEVTLDVSKLSAPYQTVRIGQGDKSGTTIVAHIEDNGVAASLSGMTARFCMRLPDRQNYVMDSACTVSGSTVTYVVDESKCASVSGITDIAYFELLRGSTVICGTSRFSVEVLRSATDGTREASSYVTEVDELLDRLSGAEAAENARAAAEATRVSNETARRSAESTRSSNETTRVNNENARKSAETTRVSNESSRRSAETTREASESERIANEASRRSAETTRAANEDERIASEATRKSAETERVASERTRSTKHATAMIDAEYATNAANEAAERANEAAAAAMSAVAAGIKLFFEYDEVGDTNYLTLVDATED